jgi:biopolymer transport protein TolR
MALKRHNSLKSLICRIDVTAFAAVMLALVWMFLARYAVVDHYDKIPVDLAHVSHPSPMPKELREDVMEVAITRDGQIYYGIDHIRIDQLPDAIRKSLSQGSERRVYIRADMRARYGAVKQVVDQARSAGVQDVVLVVDERRTTKVPSSQRSRF